MIHTYKFKFTFFLLLSILIGTQLLFAQQVTVAPFSVKQSNLIEDLKTLRISNPKISAAEFSKQANSLLEKQGINFVFAFDAATCQKIEAAKSKLKDPNAPLNLKATLKSPLGESAALLLPEPAFTKTDCLPCYVSIPVMEATAKDFVTSVEGKNIKFFLPANFILSDVFLVDNADLKTVKKSWKIPFRTIPLSISDSGNIIYLGFAEPELKDLALMVFSEGVFQFTPKNEIDADIKVSPLKDFPKDALNANLSFLKFKSGELIQTIKFSTACGN